MKKYSYLRLFLTATVLLTALLSAALLSGCGRKKNASQIVLTSDFMEDEVFRIEDVSCTKSEVMVYLVNSENRYSEVFGEGIWDKPIGDSTLEGRYKETILARLAQIKSMTLLAQQYNLELDEEEENKVAMAARDYFSYLTDEDKTCMGCDLDTITVLYHDFALASKLYDYITSDVNPEISDDEARTITVNGILVKTFSVDENGIRHDFSEEEKKSAYQRILVAKSLLDEGAEFDIVAAEYNEDTQNTYSFGRGVMPPEYEEVAFSLSADEISDVVETEYGYHIIRCLTTFNKDETDANKGNIVEQRKQAAFDAAYDAFVVNLTSNLNEPLWSSIRFDKSMGAKSNNFFDIYDKFFTVDIQEAERPSNDNNKGKE